MSARILVVDDVPANVKLLEAKLAAEYFEVITAFNGEQALARFARELAAVRKVDEDQCIRELEEYLARNAKRSATESAKTEEDSAEEAA